jgi:hypothetical protein
MDREPLVRVLGAAILFVPTPAESAAAASPPYPLPAALRPHRDRVAAELAGATGSDAPVATRILGPVRSVADTVPLLLRHDDIDFPDAACLLLAAGALTVADADALAAGRGDRLLGLRRQVVLTCLHTGDLDRAHAAAAALGERAWVGHRDIASWHARRGEAGPALALWPKLAAGTERHRMARLRTDLVRGVARAHGWQPALALTADRRVGAAFGPDALVPLARTGDVDALAAVLTGPAAGRLDELQQLGLLVTAVVADSPRAPAADHPRVAELLDRLTAVDPATDRATMRTRDHLLSALWPALGSTDTLARVRRTVRTPALRRDLTVLPRDVR